MNEAVIVVAGATGNLGSRVVGALRERGANVRALVRATSNPARVQALRQLGATIAEVDFRSLPSLTQGCSGAYCVVSTLSGVRQAIVQAQTSLLEAAIQAGVPRFIPSDFSIDVNGVPPGTNRNLDLRREFGERLEQAPIAATSILSGMFTDLLTGPAPVILFPLRRVLYWGNPNQPLDFTTMDDTAAFTAAAALDPSTPRYLRIAGDQQSASGLAEVASAVAGKKFRLLRVGGLNALDRLIHVVRRVVPGSDAAFPPWQGMQYLRNMFSGRAKLTPLDNDRYPDIRWTPVSSVLAAR